MMDSYVESLEDQYYDDWVLFKRILSYLKPYRFLVALAIILLFCISLLQLAGPYLTKVAIDDYIKLSNYDGLDKIALIFLVFLVMVFVFQFCQTLLMQYIGQKVMYGLRTQVFSHFHKMSFKFFDHHPIGKMITRVVNDVEILNEMLTSGLILVFSDLFTLVGIFIMLFYLDSRLALIVCLVFPFLLIATQAYRTRARDAFRKNRVHISNLNSFLQENLSGMYTVQLFNQERKHDQNFREINGDKVKEELRALHYNAIYQPSIDIFSAVGIGLVIWYGGGKYIQEEIQLGVLVAFLQYIQKFFDPIRDLAEKFNIIQSALASSERIFETLDSPEELPNPPTPIPIKKIKGSIEFKGVWFAYKNSDYVLKNISFMVKEGESLAIVGSTGSGKTTIINLLCRFYDLDKGDVLIDGTPVSLVNKYDLRRQIALVQQDVFLFSGSIGNNIRLGNPDLGSEEIEAVSRSVHLHDFISRLPEQYEQEIQEKGSSLSMGQRQLLSFARAMILNPRILILDEATSSVDTETEQLVQEAMKKLIKGRTSIIIAHRLSTLRNVDKVLVLKGGQIKEFGSQKELLKKKGIYFNLMSLQAKNNSSSWVPP